MRVLVVDDSVSMRAAICRVLAGIPDVQVVGEAGDGHDALRIVNESRPDLVLLDLSMPNLDGFGLLRLLMAAHRVSVIIVSDHSQRENVFRALELGAIDFVAKPASLSAPAFEEELRAKVEMVRSLSPAHARRRSAAPSPLPRGPSAAKVGTGAARRQPEHLVVVGASTGGPAAIVELVQSLTPSLSAAVVIAQHMPERFTAAFAERLGRAGPFAAREAGASAEPLAAGEVVVCPGGKCIVVEERGTDFIVMTGPARAADRYVPSVDRLFESAAIAATKRVTGVILTGMGNDGSAGAIAIKRSGGLVLAEADSTAVVFGMPGAAVRAGAVDACLPLPDLLERLAQRLAPR